MEILFICLQIFFGRIIDVSLGTVRTILTVREKSAFAALTGFFESLLWFIVVRQALSALDGSIFIAVSYALGFAAGTYIGGRIARKFIRSNMAVHVVTSKRNPELINAIQCAGFAVTVLDAKPSEYGGEKFFLFSEIISNRLEEYKQIIYAIDPKAFITVQETKHYYNGFIKKK